MRIVLPGHHDVVGSHPIRDIVAAERGGVRHPARDSAFRRHHIDFRVSIVLSREGNRLAVGGEAREHFIADIARQPPGDAPRGRNGVQIPGITEDDLVAVNCRETQETSLLLGKCGYGPQQEEERQPSEVG